MIWEHVPIMQPICKALISFDRAKRFKFLHVRDLAALSRLHGLLQRNPLLGAYCQEFQFTPSTRQMTEPITLQYLESTLNSLERVRSVMLLGSWTGTHLILDEGFAKRSLKHMRCLRIGMVATCIQGEYGRVPTFLKNLQHYPALEELRLVLTEEGTPPPPPFPPPADDTPIRIPNVKHLALSGDVDGALTTSLLEALPSLAHFEFLPADAISQNYADALKACPSSLLSINLEDHAFQDEPPSQLDLIDEHFHHFNHLESLTLDIRFFSSTQLFRHLKDPLPLKSLTLSFSTRHAVHTVDLIKLIDPKSPLHNSTLKKIELCTVAGQQGDTTALDGYDENGPFLEDWDRPAWIEGQMDYKGVKELVEFGQKNGVLVEGWTVDMLEVQDAIEHETAWAKEMWEDDLAEFQPDTPPYDFSEFYE